MADTLVYHRAKTFECEYYTNDFEAAFNHFKLQAVFYSHILYLYYIKLYFIFYILYYFYITTSDSLFDGYAAEVAY